MTRRRILIGAGAVVAQGAISRRVSAAPFKQRWRRSLDGTPIIGGTIPGQKVVYLGMADGGLRLVALKTGRLLDQTTLPGAPTQMLTTGGRLVVATDDGSITGFNPNPLSKAWSVLLGDPVTDLATDGQQLYAATESQLFAIGLERGSRQWTIESPRTNVAATSDGVLSVGAATDAPFTGAPEGIAIFDPGSGERRTVRSFDGEFDGALTSEAGVVHVGIGGALRAIDPASGATQWKREGTYVGAISAGTRIAAFEVGDQSAVRVFAASSGEFSWATSVADGVYMDHDSVAGRLVVASASAPPFSSKPTGPWTVTAHDIADGTRQWRREVEALTFVSAAHGRVIFGSDSQMTAYGPRVSTPTATSPTRTNESGPRGSTPEGTPTAPANESGDAIWPPIRPPSIPSSESILKSLSTNAVFSVFVVVVGISVGAAAYWYANPDEHRE